MEKEFLVNVLGSDSWTLSHIMPGVMRHDNATEENRENATQIEQLQDTPNKSAWSLLIKQTWDVTAGGEREDLRSVQLQETYFSQHIWKVCHEHHKSNLTVSRVPVYRKLS